MIMLQATKYDTVCTTQYNTALVSYRHSYHTDTRIVLVSTPLSYIPIVHSYVKSNRTPTPTHSLPYYHSPASQMSQKFATQ